MKSKKVNIKDLCEREIKILQLLADGFENRQIAELLYVSAHTVKAHISSILKKMKVNNRTQAVSTAMRKGLIK